MLYPTYTEYIDQINTALDAYKHLQVVRKANSEPFYYTGNYSIVFKMQDVATQKYYAVKCFTRGHAQLITQYQQISKCLGAITSPHLLSFDFLENELFIDSKQTTDNEFACVVMQWAEGTPLMPALRDACTKADTFTLKKIYQAFITLSQWLLAQPFAHGDIKPDNLIWNSNTATLQLVDYDGCYIPSGITLAMEQGSSGYSHPQRATQSFDKHIDDFSILVMALSLKALCIQPSLFAQFNNDTDILFTQRHYVNWRASEVNIALQPLDMQDATMPILLGLLHSTILQTEARVDLLEQILGKMKGEVMKVEMTIGEWWDGLDEKLKNVIRVGLQENDDQWTSKNLLNTSTSSVLEIRNLKWSSMSDIGSLQYLTNLKTLQIWNCDNISDISALQYLINLTSLSINKCGNISDIGSLKYLTSLRINECGNISDISPLQYLTNLNTLKIWSCDNISDISSLQHLMNLTSLSVGNCHNISDISSLQQLTNLTSLEIWNCKNISDLSPLQSLQSLTNLEIAWCSNISDLSPLQNLQSLTSLKIYSCSNISDLSPLEYTQNLISLEISSCSNINSFQIENLKAKLHKLK
jgi:Protein kinase domain/Leucine Rich repeats (2 copies)